MYRKGKTYSVCFMRAYNVTINFNSLLDAHERPSANYFVVLSILYALSIVLFRLHVTLILRVFLRFLLAFASQCTSNKYAKNKRHLFAVYGSKKNLLKCVAKRARSLVRFRTLYAHSFSTISHNNSNNNETREKKQPKSGEAIYF